MKTKMLIISAIFAVLTVPVCASGAAEAVTAAADSAVSISGTAVPSADAEADTFSAAYYPMHVGNVLYLKGFKKKEPEKKLYVKAEIKSTEMRDGKMYTYFYAPSVNVRYLVRSDAEGISMKVMRYPFPFFGFPIEIELTPAMRFVAFPLKVGEKWTYKGKAEALIFGLRLGREVNTDFEIISKETLVTAAGNFDAFHILANVDEGDGKGKRPEKYWYAKGMGYSRADTSGHFAELTGYRIWSEETGSFIEKLPEGEKSYE